ncbi:uncharacterized protein [Dysidea avara]
MEYYYSEGLFSSDISATAITSCSAYSVDIQPVDDKLVSDPLEIHCLVDTPNITNSDDVTISWTLPNGTITNDTNRLTITPTVSHGTNHISTLQFSYLSEDDEGLYECNTTVLGYNDTKTVSVELTNLIIPTPNVIVTALNNQQVGDPLLLECNVTTVRGITSSVDIVWITNDEVVRRVNNVSWETVDNSVVYNDTYNNGSILSEDDDGTVYQCKVEINTTPLVSSISTFVVRIQSMEQQIFVGSPYYISCSIFVSGEYSTFIWTGSNGVITDDGRLTAVTSDISNDTTSTSTVQFSYLRESDEGSYRCDVTVFGYNYNYSTSSSVELNNFTVPTPNVIVTALNNQQVGDPLLLECNVTTVKGITSSVDIVWITNDKEVERVNNVSGETVDNYSVYRSIYNDSGIVQDNRTYQCSVNINGFSVVSATDTFIYVAPVTTPTSTPGASSSSTDVVPVMTPTSTPGASSTDVVPVTTPTSVPGASSPGASSSSTAIAISSIAAVIVLTFILAILGYFIYKKRRSLKVKWSPHKRGENTVPPFDDDTDYSVIGKEAPSTCEYLGNEKVLHWIKDVQMPKIDEECASIRSGEMTNDDMLNLVYGSKGNPTKVREVKKCYHTEMLTTKDPYLSESVAFDSSNNRYSVNSSTMSDRDFQGALGDYYCEDTTQGTSKCKHNVELESADYDTTTSGLDRGYYADYDNTKTASLSNKDLSMTVPLESAGEARLEVAKESKDDCDMPYIPASEDTGVYTGSYLSDSPIPPPDGGYTSCSSEIHSIDKTTSYLPNVTSPTSPTSHHSDQSLPFGDYVDHNVALQHKSTIVNMS